MSFNHSILKRLTTPEGSVEATEGVSASSPAAIEETIAAGQTAYLINLAFTVAGLKSIWLLSDQVITIKTNSSSVPDDTIILAAGVPLEWNTGYTHTVGGVTPWPACPFTAPVTKIYVANSSGTTANLSCRVLADATP